MLTYSDFVFGIFLFLTNNIILLFRYIYQPNLILEIISKISDATMRVMMLFYDILSYLFLFWSSHNNFELKMNWAMSI